MIPPTPEPSSPVKVKVAASLSLLLSLGLPVMVALGAVVSTTHVWVAEALLPASSVAVATYVCEPSARLANASPQVVAEPSIVQVVLARPDPPFSSAEVTVRSAAVLVVSAAGPSARLTVGSVMSINHV